MRLRKHQQGAGPISGEADVPQRRRRESRGLGPFTGRQLTTIICVAIVAAVMVPTAALAAGGAFSNNSATVPAVKATNANAHGIGVQGTGKKYGVYSNGPLGVAAGKSLSCTGCVGVANLSAAASGAFGASTTSVTPLSNTATSLAYISGMSAGSYVVSYTATADGESDSGTTECWLSTPSGVQGDEQLDLTAGSTSEFAYTGIATVPNSSGIAIFCSTNEAPFPSAILNSSLTAIKAAHIG